MKKRGERSKKNPSEKGMRFFLVRGVTMGLFLMAVLLVVFSFILTRVDLPFGLIGPAMQMIAAVSSALAGYTAARRIRKKGLPVGAASGACVFAVLLVLSLFFENGVDLQILFKFLVCILGGMIGGVLGVNAKASRHKLF